MVPMGLTILKIIGIGILTVLGVALLALLLVLLVPVRYSCLGSYNGGLKGAAKVSWLLGAIAAKVTYEDGLDVEARVLGVRLSGGKKKKKRALRQPKTGKEPQEDDWLDEEEPRENEGSGKAVGKRREEASRLAEEGRREEEAPISDGEETSGTAGEGRKEETSGTAGEGRREKASETGGEPVLKEQKDQRGKKDRKGKKAGKKKTKRKKGKPGIRERVKRAVEVLKERLNHVRETKEKVAAFVAEEENQKTFRLLWRQCKRLLRHILPRKVRGSVWIGFDDPAATGSALAAAGLLYAWYGSALQVFPVFDENVLKAEGSFRGRVRLGTVLCLMLRLIGNQNFRRLAGGWLRKGGNEGGRE